MKLLLAISLFIFLLQFSNFCVRVSCYFNEKPSKMPNHKLQSNYFRFGYTRLKAACVTKDLIYFGQRSTAVCHQQEPVKDLTEQCTSFCWFPEKRHSSTITAGPRQFCTLGKLQYLRPPLYITVVFFKVFKRVSWWSFRVSAPFSLLCLIFLIDFHKKASFCPIMLNYLNTTFTFGKQTEDTFINRNFHCRPTYSFIHSFSCPLFLWEESRGQQS